MAEFIESKSGALGFAQLAGAGALGVGLAGATYGARTAKKSADMNANILNQNAETQMAAAGQREEAHRRQVRLIAGEQRAAIAQSGTGFGGSAADIMEKSSANAELDALTIRYDAMTRKTAFENEANTMQWQGRRARTGGYLSAASSLLSGAASYGGGM